MTIQSNLAFSREEYRGRLRRVQKTLAEQRLHGLLLNTPENICYVSGHDTPGYYYMQVLVVPDEGDPALVLRRLEQRGTEANSWLDPERVVPYDDTDNPMDAVIRVLREMRLDRGRLGVEKSGWFLPVEKYEQLVQALPDAAIVNGSGSWRTGARSNRRRRSPISEYRAGRRRRGCRRLSITSGRA